MRKFFLIALFFVSSSAFAFSEITLNNLIWDVDRAHSWACKGASCRQVWNEQVRALNALVDYVDYYVPFEYTLPTQTGAMAYNASYRICMSTATGRYETIAWLVAAQNRGLARLLNLQHQAYVNPYTCQKNVN